ncbi:hypothetical protein [Saccharibacillus kuerlensis]|uniref:ABC-2 family transporter protein n=1 Tax=Saccharibacillus kuerlensis TaxID=459527 RepID=A0ABQ2KVR7_9BACL|nr:hypothetical protein [Saccharibacillus kuerlensis]GGN91873.1 hypothetical protein GCM10010969_03790 [Saccharibacillus kuerlensis]
MRVILHEIRHIFRPGTLILLLAFNLLFYWMYLGFYFQHFPNGRPSMDTYDIQLKMVERFGSRMDAEEFQVFKAEYEQRKLVADERIAGDPEFAKYGFHNYEQYQTRAGENPFSELDEHIDFSLSSDPNTLGSLFWELQSREWMIEAYEGGGEAELIQWRALESSPAVLETVQRRIDDGSMTSIQSDTAVRYYLDVLQYSSLLALVSVLLITVPLFLRDRHNGLIQLQYASATGRRLFGKKIAAALCSAFLVLSVQLAVLAVLFSQKNIDVFYHIKLHSYLNFWPVSWFDLTFIQYIMLTIAAVYIVCLLAVLVTALLSSVVPNYMAIIGSLAMLVVVFVYWGRQPLITDLTTINYDRLTQPLLYGGLMLVISGTLIFRWRREKASDIVG